MRRYVGPIVLIGAVLGVLTRLLVASTVSSSEALPFAAEDWADSTAHAIPLGETGLLPDSSSIAQRRMSEASLTPFRGLHGRFGIAVKDFGSGLGVFVNEGVPFPAASLYKLPLMYEVFKLREAGVLTFQEDLAVGPEDAAFGPDSLPWPIGTRITIGTAVERMVTLSDNSSAFMLLRRVGVSRVNEDARRLGLRQTYIRGENVSTSALDMLDLLELIATRRAIDEPVSAEMAHLLARQQIRDRIPARLPAEAIVANKTGNWEDAIHDVAIIYTPRATLGMAFLSDGVADPDSVSAAMAQAARSLYEVVNDPAFETQPNLHLPPMVQGSYAAAPKLPVATAIQAAPRAATPPTRGPQIAPALAQTPTSAPLSSQTAQPAQANAAAPTPTPAQRGSQQPPPATPTATPDPTRTARDAPRPTSTPTVTTPTPTRTPDRRSR